LVRKIEPSGSFSGLTGQSIICFLPGVLVTNGESPGPSGDCGSDWMIIVLMG